MFVHSVILVIQQIDRKVVIYVVNVKPIKIARAVKFASNLDGAFAVVLMRAANSSADRMRTVCRAIIDRLAFVNKVTLAIRTISIWAVNHKNVEIFKRNVAPIRIVKLAKFA